MSRRNLDEPDFMQKLSMYVIGGCVLTCGWITVVLAAEWLHDLLKIGI